MALLEDIADELAQRTIANMSDLNDDGLQKKVADAIGHASPTLQETYNTAMRIRRAQARAFLVLEEHEKERG